MCVNRNTLKNWLKLSVHPHICGTCGKAFSYEAQLKVHARTHPNEDGVEKTNIRYKAEFKQEVTNYALENTLQDAITRFQLPHSTINNWVKRISNPRTCQLCGKPFSNESTVRRHIEQVHKNTPEGAEELLRRSEEIQSSQPFSEFLAHHDLLPSEEQIVEISKEKERKKEEKEEFALIAQEIMSRGKDTASLDIVKSEDVADDMNLNIFSPITCMNVTDDGTDDQGTEMPESIKSEYELGRPIQFWNTNI